MIAQDLFSRQTIMFLFAIALNGPGIWMLAQQFQPDQKPILDTIKSPLPRIQKQEADTAQPRTVALYDETFSRPLFMRTRKPYEAPPLPPLPPLETPVAPSMPTFALPPLPTQNAPVEANLKVSGISVISGKASALLMTGAEPQGTWVAQGTKIGGWHVVRITNDSVVLNANQKELVIELYPANP